MRTPQTSPRFVLRALVALVLVATVVLTACAPEAPPGPPYCPGVPPGEAVFDIPDALGDPSGEVMEANLRLWVDLLAAPQMRGRHATSAEARGVAALLAAHMSRLGLEPPFRGGSFCQAFPVVEQIGFNVVGHLPAPIDGRPAIVLGAHYDGQGVHPMVYPSADDNASGVAALLEVARLARQRSWPFQLVFIAVNAEEVGFIGAERWVQRPTVALEDLTLMVNFDMVGRPWPGTPATTIGFAAEGSQADLVEAWWNAASAASGLEVRRLYDVFTEGDMKSDHDVFSRHVPALFISTGLHEDHHERTDTPEKVDVGQIARSVRLTLALLEHLSEVMASQTSE